MLDREDVTRVVGKEINIIGVYYCRQLPSANRLSSGCGLVLRLDIQDLRERLQFCSSIMGLDRGNETTTQLLTLLNVSATKASKRKWASDDARPKEKLNKRRVILLDEPTVNIVPIEDDITAEELEGEESHSKADPSRKDGKEDEDMDEDILQSESRMIHVDMSNEGTQ